MGGSSYGNDTLRADFGAINDVAAAIGTYVGAMEGALDDLLREFHSVLGADWEGSASEACSIAKDKWDKGVEQIRHALFSVGDKLGAAAADLQAMETAVAASFH